MKKIILALFIFLVSNVVYSSLYDNENKLIEIWDMNDLSSNITGSKNIGYNFDLEYFGTGYGKESFIPYSPYAIEFSGDYAVGSDKLIYALNKSERNMTLNFYLGNINYNTDRTLLDCRAGSPINGLNLQFTADNGGQFYVIFSENGNSHSFQYYPFTEKFFMLTLVINNSKLYTYINASLLPITQEIGGNAIGIIPEFYLGKTSTGTQPININISQFVIWNRTLNQEEINSLLSENIIRTGLPQPELNITYPKNNDLITDMLFNVSFYFQNIQPNNCTLYENSTGMFKQMDSIKTGTINITGEDVNTTYYFYNQSNVLRFFRMEENTGTKMIDHSLNHLNGTYVNGVSWSASKGKNQTGNYTTDYDGISQYSNIGSITGFKSISFWLNSDTRAGYDYYIGHNNFRLYAHTTTGNIILGDSIGGTLNSGFDIDVHTGEWIYIVAISDGSNSALWINGEKKISGTLEAVSSAQMDLMRWSGATHQTDGRMDEVIIFDKRIRNSTIQKIYNDGLLRYNITTVAGNSTEINSTLEENTFYNLTAYYPTERKDNIELNIKCFNELETANDSVLITLDTDITPPSINVLYPENNKSYNVNMFVNFSYFDNEDTICSLNLSNFYIYFSNSSFYSFYENTLENNDYSVLINCTDKSGNSGYGYINFTKDVTLPVITFILPSYNNDSVFINNTNYRLNITGYDINLYGYNYSIYLNDILFKNKLETDISYPYYTINDLIKFNNSGIGYIDVCFFDSHTKNNIKMFTKTENNTLFFNKLKIYSNNAKKVKTNKKKSKYTFEFEYNNFDDKKEYFIESEYSLNIVNDNYIGHFIDIKQGIWVDFEGYGLEPEIYKYSDYKYSVNFQDIKLKNVKFESVGLLNINCKRAYFNVTENYEPIPITTAEAIDQNLKLTNTILFYAFFIIIQIVLLIIGLRFTNFWVILLSCMMGVFISISFIQYVALNNLIQNCLLIYIFINLLLMFAMLGKGNNTE